MKRTIAAGALGIVDRTEKTPVPTGKADVFRDFAFLAVLQEKIRERVVFQRKKLQENAICRGGRDAKDPLSFAERTYRTRACERISNASLRAYIESSAARYIDDLAPSALDMCFALDMSSGLDMCFARDMPRGTPLPPKRGVKESLSFAERTYRMRVYEHISNVSLRAYFESSAGQLFRGNEEIVEGLSPCDGGRLGVFTADLGDQGNHRFPVLVRDVRAAENGQEARLFDA